MKHPSRGMTTGPERKSDDRIRPPLDRLIDLLAEIEVLRYLNQTQERSAPENDDR